MNVVVSRVYVLVCGDMVAWREYLTKPQMNYE